MNTTLKVSGYLSIILAVLIFFNADLLGAIPFIINAVYSFRYVEKKFKNREFMIAYTAIMFILNLFLIGENELAVFDTGAWLFFLYAWLTV